MLPGFRFLLAAVVLSMSILIFGLGAAALLRAAHEEFASNPTWRAPPETRFAEQSEPSRPVLAALVVEPPQAERKQTPIAAPEAPAAIVSPTGEPEQVAALKPKEALPPEAAKSEPAVETPPASDPIPVAVNAAAEAPAAATESKIAAIEEMPPQGVPAAPEVPPAPEIDTIAAKIAALGDAPVAVEVPPPPNAASTEPDKSAARKRLRARRARERRRLAALHRAMLAKQAQLQPVFDVFGQASYGLPQPTYAPPQVTINAPPRVR
jgi:hypothetical protein